MIHRQATAADVDSIVEIAVASVSINPMPVRIDRGAMRETALSMIGQPQHFVWVTEREGKVVACVGACTQPSFWFQRQQCSVLLYFSLVPGAGLPLIREFARWVKARAVIKVAVIELEPEVEPRLVEFFKRLGFTRESRNLTYIRGAV